MHASKVIGVRKLAEQVLSIKLTKPADYSFKEGQSVFFSLDKNTKRQFSIASTNKDDFIELIVKIYSDREGFTKSISKLNSESLVYISEPTGYISFKEKGMFIAGGTGLVPFISIFRNLRSSKKLEGNKLMLSFRNESDIILLDELKQMEREGLSTNITLTREKKEGYFSERIGYNFLKNKINDLTTNFYICGPIRFVGEIQYLLTSLGANPEKIVLES